MSFLEDKCSLFPVVTPKEIEGFTCGDHDLDEFFTNDCFAYSKELLGKTYCFKMDENPKVVVCAFTLANAGVRVSDLPNARKKKIETNIPHVKALKDYPAVLVARLGVSKDFHSLHIGSDVLSYIKLWFLEPYNKTGCRFMVVDAYNEPATIAFYEKNDFKTVFSTEQQEKDYRHLESDVSLNTRLMYYDLMRTAEEYM
uniref:N-acetyltransferase n=1 Tax=uncultured Prevotella sp. TaxID=159272 RepID=A0A6G8F1J1_9BACT|nr:N-acetyltransferase [uncultured Prevotella sp.]